MSKRGMKKGRLTELDRLMDEGTVNMLSDSNSKAPTANKKAKLEALRLKRLQVLSNVRNRSADSGKNLREKKTIRRRSTESLPLASPSAGFKGRRASLLATLKEQRVAKAELRPDFKPIPETPVPKRVLTSVTEDGLGHVTLAFEPRSRWTVDGKTLLDLTRGLKALDDNPRVKVILLSSSGAKFCNGLDLRELLLPSPNERNAAAETLARATSNYLLTLGSLKKLTILSAQSSCANLFVSSLPLFDLVYASDKASFRTNYLSLNTVPEGSGVLAELCPQAFSSLVYGRRTVTASEAKDFGLVTEVLWPARFQEEVVIRVRAFLRSDAAVTRVVKSCLRRAEALSRERLELEERNLVGCWTSEGFQKAARDWVEGRDLIC